MPNDTSRPEYAGLTTFYTRADAQRYCRHIQASAIVLAMGDKFAVVTPDKVEAMRELLASDAAKWVEPGQ